MLQVNKAYICQATRLAEKPS